MLNPIGRPDQTSWVGSNVVVTKTRNGQQNQTENKQKFQRNTKKYEVVSEHDIHINIHYRLLYI